jgi:outer membrane receptor protein involved in Fe transport
VRDIVQNRGGIKTTGIDVGANYALALGQFGNVDISMQGTMIDKLEFDNGLSASWDCAGYYGVGCDTPRPEWRHRVKVTYAMPIGWDASLQWRYFGSADVSNKNPSPALNAPFAPFNERIASQSYIDLSVSTRLADAYTFRFGINNIFDRSPPIVGTNGANIIINGCAGSQNTIFPTCNANTFPNLYDAMGRYIFAGVTVDF